MKSILPEKLINFAQTLPYPLYIVGGAVRDFAAGLHSETADTDVCAPADVADFAARAEKAGFEIKAEYKNTGTVKFFCGEEDFEFTCFRSDEYVRGGHRPVATYLTDDINLDARRRDFKCNAVYYDIAAGKFVDPLGGLEDIDNRRISTVAPAKKVFGEDGLRLMRLARISAQTGFLPDAECLQGALANSALIRDVSAERIFAELMLILNADKKYGISMGQYAGLKILKNTGVLQIILPELCAGEGMVQNKKYHKHDVLEHSLRCAAYADERVRFAALLHDIGKPYCLKTAGNFIGHDEEGARIAEEICARLKAPKKLTEETAELVKLHMYDFRCDARENKIRKFIIENVGILDKLLLIKQADYSACTDDFSVAPSVEKFSKIYTAMKSENVPFALKELAVKGNDLIEAGVPAQEVGNTLLQLLTDCAIKLCKNDREKILTRLKKVYMPTLNPAVYAVYAQKFAEEEAEKRAARAVAVADKKRLRAEKYDDGKRKKSSPKSS